MATINLGAIKFNWKGAYNSSTSYAVDDVVSSGGNSYVCIQAHSNQAVGNATAYWNIMSSAGTNGTDLTSTLSARGDLVFKGASALTRLPKGTAGYYLKQGANDPEWGAVSAGGVVQTVQAFKYDKFTTSATTMQDTGLQVQITPTSASNKIFLLCTGVVGSTGSLNRMHVDISGTTTQFIGNAVTGREHSQTINSRSSDAGWQQLSFAVSGYDSANTTSQVTYKLRAFGSNGLSLNSAWNNDGEVGNNFSHLLAMEIAV